MKRIEMLALKGYLKAKAKFHDFCVKENGDTNIVSMVILIGIAVILAVAFKDAIADLLKTLFSKIDDGATSAVTSSVSFKDAAPAASGS